jgi:hypothetical protein
MNLRQIFDIISGKFHIFTFRIYEIYKGKYWFHSKKKASAATAAAAAAAVDKIFLHAYSLDQKT